MSTPEPAPGQAARGVDPHGIAYRVHAHAFNVLTDWLARDERFVPLSVRDNIATAVVGAIEPLIRDDERAAALNGREIVVKVGSGWERRKARDPRALAEELLGAIDSRLADDPTAGERPAPELAQLAALRELLDEVGVMAANADEDGGCWAVLEEIAMRIGAAEVESLRDPGPAADAMRRVAGDHAKTASREEA